MSILTAYDKFIQQALKYGFSLFGIPKTGMNQSFRTGDDYYFNKGYPVTVARFVDNGDGTIADMATGLMWVKDVTKLGAPFYVAASLVTMDWNEAIDNCLALTYAGHSDWRLPNSFELISLYQLRVISPILDTNFFKNIQNTNYWTSTTYAPISSTSRVQLDLAGGAFSVAEPYILDYVLPVRGGVPV